MNEQEHKIEYAANRGTVIREHADAVAVAYHGGGFAILATTAASEANLTALTDDQPGPWYFTDPFRLVQFWELLVQENWQPCTMENTPDNATLWTRDPWEENHNDH